MDKNKLYNDAYKYFLFSTLAWDWPDRKVEDGPENEIYFFSEEYKRQTCKPLEKLRKSYKVSYHENKESDTSFNVYENANEYVIAFRGSDSKKDWLADFDVFKIKFKENNTYTSQLLSTELSSEEYDQMLIDEFMRSQEDFSDILLKGAKLTNSITSLFKRDDKMNNIGVDTVFSSVKDLFDSYKNTIFIHRGFLSQFISIANEFSKVLENSKNRNIVICGHSLGSSLARLAFIYTSLNYSNKFENTRCFVYGTPKIGNIYLNKFCDQINKNNKLITVNIETDLCSNVPPDSMGYFKPVNNISLKNIKAPFFTKMDHTVFYYLYCFMNKAPVKFNLK